MDFAAFPDYATISARKKVLHQAAYGIDVATCVGFPVRQELRRCVWTRTAQTFLQNMCISIGKPEVNEFDVIIGLGNKDILRLDVIMDDALPMHGPDGFHELSEDPSAGLYRRLFLQKG